MVSAQLRMWLLAAMLLLASIVDAAGTPQGRATCTNPSKRKEWRQLTRDEKADWVRAVKCLATLPHDPKLRVVTGTTVRINASSSYYDDLVYIHMDINPQVHVTGRFLPWHRWYIHVYEQVLQQKCGYKGTSPYWDWTLDAGNFFESSIWSESDPSFGLGGWGDRNDDNKLKDGAFGESSGFKLTYPVPHTLRRNFTLQPYLTGGLPGMIPDPTIQANSTFTKAQINRLVNGYVGDFKGFQADFEFFSGSHASVHLITGGDFGGQCPSGSFPTCFPGPTFSANEPMFWLHHAMVDKVWWDWQHANPKNMEAFEGGAVQRVFPPAMYQQYPNGGPPMLTMADTLPAAGLFSETTIGNVFNTLSGDLCYVYV